MQARITMRAGEVGNGIARLDRIAGSAGERLIHVCQERSCPQARSACHFRERAGEGACVLPRLHEGAIACLHIHHQSVEPRRQLLGKNGGGDQWDGFNCGRHIADGVEPRIRRSQIAGLPNDRAARRLQHKREKRFIRRRIISWNGFELVERAARVPQSASRNHRHAAAARRHHGRQHEAHIIADTARRMLVEHWTAKRVRAPVHHPARMRHGLRQRCAFAARHAAKKHSHCKSSGLLACYRAARQPGDKKSDGLPAQHASVAFGADDLLRQHQLSPAESAASSSSSNALAPMRNVRGPAQSGPMISSASER